MSPSAAFACLIGSAADERFRIPHRIAKPVVSNRARGFRHLARCRTLFATRVTSGLVEIGFELTELLFELVFLLVDLASLPALRADGLAAS